MSVAFRRDSDEEHLEPRFELPIPVGPNLVTRRGLDLIDARVAELEAAISRAAAAGLPALKRDLRYWQSRQITAELASLPPCERVEFGSRVTISLNGKRKTFQIVGSDEAEPASGLLAFTAPLSRAVLGAEVDDQLPFGSVADAITIVAIGAP